VVDAVHPEELRRSGSASRPAFRADPSSPAAGRRREGSARPLSILGVCGIERSCCSYHRYSSKGETSSRPGIYAAFIPAASARSDVTASCAVESVGGLASVRATLTSESVNSNPPHVLLVCRDSTWEQASIVFHSALGLEKLLARGSSSGPLPGLAGVSPSRRCSPAGARSTWSRDGWSGLVVRRAPPGPPSLRAAAWLAIHSALVLCGARVGDLAGHCGRLRLTAAAEAVVGLRRAVALRPAWRWCRPRRELWKRRAPARSSKTLVWSASPAQLLSMFGHGDEKRSTAFDGPTSGCHLGSSARSLRCSR